MNKLLISMIALSVSGCVSIPTTVVNEEEKQEAFAENKGIVSMAVVDAYDSSQIMTTWTSVHNEEKDVNLITGRVGWFKWYGSDEYKRYTVELEPGVYSLSHIEFDEGSSVVVNNTQGDGFGWWSKDGWNERDNQPEYLSFEVKAGEELELPCISIDILDDKKMLSISTDNEKNIFTIGNPIIKDFEFKNVKEACQF